MKKAKSFWENRAKFKNINIEYFKMIESAIENKDSITIKNATDVFDSFNLNWRQRKELKQKLLKYYIDFAKNEKSVKELELAHRLEAVLSDGDGKAVLLTVVIFVLLALMSLWLLHGTYIFLGGGF